MATKKKPRRQYLDGDGTRLPSVTTILGATSDGKERLRSWLARPGAITGGKQDGESTEAVEYRRAFLDACTGAA